MERSVLDGSMLIAALFTGNGRVRRGSPVYVLMPERATDSEIYGWSNIMQTERRKHNRFDIPQIFKIEFMREDPFEASGLNISEGGLLCETDYPIEPLSRVFMTFILPDKGHEILRNEGSVLRVTKKNHKYHFAVGFGDMTDEDRAQLRKYLNAVNRN